MGTLLQSSILLFAAWALILGEITLSTAAEAEATTSHTAPNTTHNQQRRSIHVNLLKKLNEDSILPNDLEADTESTSRLRFGLSKATQQLANRISNSTSNQTETEQIIREVLSNRTSSNNKRSIAQTLIQEEIETMAKVVGLPGAEEDAQLRAWFLATRVFEKANLTKAQEDIYDNIFPKFSKEVVNKTIIFLPKFATQRLASGASQKRVETPPEAEYEYERDMISISPTDFNATRYLGTGLENVLRTLSPGKSIPISTGTQVTYTSVQNTASFLQSNPNLRGIVFPAPSLTVQSTYELWRRHCKIRSGSNGCLFNSWESWIRLGSNCELGRTCNGYNCGTYTRNVNSGRDHYECRYWGTRNNFGSTRTSSVVDFRNKQNVYWERAVQSHLTSESLQCRPGRRQGSTVSVLLVLSVGSPRYEYLCEGAIALNSRVTRSSQSMLFNLGDGTDTVYLPPSYAYPSIFLVGNDGTKTFEGGNQRNDFVFTTSCSRSLRGRFAGGSGTTDAITLGRVCAAGQTVYVDFKQGLLRTANNNNIYMSFSRIEELDGREGQKDVIQIACSTRKVFGRGGSSTQVDEITVPDDANCAYNLGIVGQSYTKITSRARSGNIYIPVLGSSPYGLNIDVDVYSKVHLNTTIQFLNANSRQTSLTGWSRSSTRLQLSLRINSASTTLTFNFKSGSQKDVAVYFNEDSTGTLRSVLYASANEAPVFYHYSTTSSRTGSSDIPNIFDLYTSSSSRVTTGGMKNDMLLIHTSSPGNLDGSGGSDTIRLSSALTTPPRIDLGSSQFKNIENVIGVAGIKQQVVTSCGTEFVALLGGSTSLADLVTVPQLICSQPQKTRILAVGKTTVVSQGNVTGKDAVHILVDGTAQRTMAFELETQSTRLENLLVHFEINHRNWQVAQVSRSQSNCKLKLTGSSVSETIQFTFKDSAAPNDATRRELITPLLQFKARDSELGALLVDRVTLQPKMVYQVGSSLSNSNLFGFSGIGNIFWLKPITSRSWTARGGNQNDIFILAPLAINNARSYVIDGGVRGENTLLLETHEEYVRRPFHVNLEQGRIGFQDKPTLGSIQNIDTVIGRENAPDTIRPNCRTKGINSRGGHASNLRDIIEIPASSSGCGFDLVMAVDQFSTVVNNASRGSFTYFVSDLVTSSLNVQATRENSHYFQFSFNPWHQIVNVTFNPKSEKLSWEVSSDQHENFQHFPMTRSSRNVDYANPAFRFAPPDSPLLSEIGVDAEGRTYSTIMLNAVTHPEKVLGIPVNLNRFVVNILTKSNLTSGVIQGCAEERNCLANQFWILEMNTGLQLLDGGACRDRECTNYLHFMTSFQQPITVDLDLCSGSVIDSRDGRDVIGRLQNIHILHATRSTTALVACGTQQVSAAGKVVIQNKNCPVDVDIGLEQYTTVHFTEKRGAMRDGSGGVVHYVFPNVMSFTPVGNSSTLLSYNHHYHLAFGLDDLSSLRFDGKNDFFKYTIRGSEYQHKVFANSEQDFYTQPILETKDGYRFLVSKDGGISIILHAQNSGSLGIDKLQKVANKLGVPVIANTQREFYFVANTGNSFARPVLQNHGHKISHLVANGGAGSIYEIPHLNNDVVLHTGFNEVSFESWSRSQPQIKQTLDLTKIVEPIRLESQPLYVPRVEQQGANLVIRMSGHERKHPGNVTIVNGTRPWVKDRLQIIHSRSMMELSGVATANGKRLTANDASWVMRPFPLRLSKNVEIYIVSPDDLEENQEIILEDVKSSNISQLLPTFKVTRNGSDVLLTNLFAKDDSELKTLKISNFSQTPSSTRKSLTKYPMPKIKVSLPGLSGSPATPEMRPLEYNFAFKTVAEIAESAENFEKLLSKIKNR